VSEKETFEDIVRFWADRFKRGIKVTKSEFETDVAEMLGGVFRSGSTIGAEFEHYTDKETDKDIRNLFLELYLDEPKFKYKKGKWYSIY